MGVGKYDYLTQGQQSAAFLLHHCTTVLEINAVPDYLQDSILESYSKFNLDDEVTATQKELQDAIAKSDALGVVVKKLRDEIKKRDKLGSE